jgi:hypothetical protein
MFYSKGLNCAIEARALLACSSITSEPCHGVTGSYLELHELFAGVQFEGAPGYPPDYECLAFPTDTFRDNLILGFISFAVTLPVSFCIFNAFCCANATDYAPSWLRWNLVRRLTAGAANWSYRVRQQSVLQTILSGAN